MEAYICLTQLPSNQTFEFNQVSATAAPPANCFEDLIFLHIYIYICIRTHKHLFCTPCNIVEHCAKYKCVSELLPDVRNYDDQEDELKKVSEASGQLPEGGETVLPADVDRCLQEGLFDAPSQVGCCSMQSRFFFFLFFPSSSIQRGGLYICTLAYKFPRSMGPNEKNTITALQGLKELERGLKGHLSLISSARPKVGKKSPAGEVNYHTNPIIRRY